MYTRRNEAWETPRNKFDLQAAIAVDGEDPEEIKCYPTDHLHNGYATFGDDGNGVSGGSGRASAKADVNTLRMSATASSDGMTWGVGKE